MRIIHFDAGMWRGRLDDDFNDDNVARVADALGLAWADRSPGATVYVGYGTRYRSDDLALLAGSVMAAYGLRVVVCEGPTPIPAVSWSAAHDPACVGVVMLTASESPCEWGGLLVRGADGGTASPSFLDRVETLVSGSVPDGRGTIERADLWSAYEAALLSYVDVAAISAAAPLVVADSLHGATGALLASLLRDAGARVVPLHDAPDVMFAGLHPNPTEPWVDECEQQVRSTGAVCGLALDEDGDRASVIDERGRSVEPHDLVGILLRHISHHQDAWSGSRVVTTLAGSARVRRQAELLGYECTVIPVGFSRIYDELGEGDVALAADERGGICLPAHLHERDGLLVALLVLELLAASSHSVSALVGELRREVGHMDYGRRDVSLDAGQIQRLRNVIAGLNPSSVAGMVPVAVSHADGLHLSFDDDSWVLLRPARTQPVVRAYAEAPSLEQRDALLMAASALASSDKLLAAS